MATKKEAKVGVEVLVDPLWGDKDGDEPKSYFHEGDNLSWYVSGQGGQLNITAKVEGTNHPREVASYNEWSRVYRVGG